MEAVFITCPYCWQKITLYLETDIGDEAISIVEDCTVCCRPMEIEYKVDNAVIKSLRYQKMDGNN